MARNVVSGLLETDERGDTIAPLDAPRAEVATGVRFGDLQQCIDELLESSGGRPALVPAATRVKIPRIEGDWKILEKLVVASVGLRFRPSATQMAAVVLHLALKVLEREVATQKTCDELAGATSHSN
jgi:hypothetical protein